MDGETPAAWLLSHFQPGSADGTTAYARQFENPYESLMLLFGERVVWKDSTLQPAKLRSSWESYLARHSMSRNSFGRTRRHN